MPIRILCRLLSHKKLNYLLVKYILKTRQKHNYEGTKAFLKGRKPGLFVNYGQFSWSWIRIRVRIPCMDPEPNSGQPNNWGSRRIGIHNTGSNPGLLRLWHWQPDALTTWLDLIHSWLDLIHTWLDIIHTWLDVNHTWLDLIHTWLDLIHTRLVLIPQTRL